MTDSPAKPISKRLSVISIITNGFLRQNPIFVLGLGLCSALAVTSKVNSAFAMGIGVMCVSVFSSLSASSISSVTHGRVRLPVYMLIISSLVICFDRILQAWYPEVSDQMGPYVGLIITNCIILSRLETFAAHSSPYKAVCDAFAVSAGYAVSLIAIAIVREMLAFGSVAGYNILGTEWKPWAVMAMSPGAFIVLAVYIWISRAIVSVKEEK
ncbi:MAG: Rnf-Nqr domain containing protein [Candidatus Auribacterota bacterium]|nr:Rnf-Nqr domain containing protein [Candidatus Auribacterota bacterium]